MTNPVGRPPRFATVEEMQEAIDAYFAETAVGEYTITGLALSLGFNTRKSLIDYEGDEEFVHTVKKAKLRIEQDYEKSLRKSGRSGDIFGLKNFGWSDAQDVNLGGQGKDKPIFTDSSVKLTAEEAYRKMLHGEA